MAGHPRPGAGKACAGLGPAEHGGDFAGARPGQWERLSRRVKQVAGFQLAARVEGAIEAGDDHLFEFRAGEASGGSGHIRQSVALRIPPPESEIPTGPTAACGAEESPGGAGGLPLASRRESSVSSRFRRSEG